MAIETFVDSKYDPDQYDSPAPGRYHVAVVKVDESGGKKGEMIVDFEVLAGTTPNQEGRGHREYFQKTQSAMGRIHGLALALGMVTKDQLNQAKATGANLVYDFEAQVGKQLHLDLQESTYEGKVRVKVDFRMYKIDDPRCASWPRNVGMLAQAGIKLSAPAAPSAGGTTPVTQPPAKPAELNLANVL